MWICGCNYLLHVALYPFLCIYSNWNYSNLLDRQFCLMIKFDFTSHFIIVLCLMVIFVSTLIIIDSSVNSKWGMGPFIYFSKGLQSICYATGCRILSWRLLACYAFIKIKLASCRLLFCVVFMCQKSLNVIDALILLQAKTKVGPI